MKFRTYLVFSTLSLISALFLSACGGSSSGSGAINTNTDHPQFFREKATNSPSYEPSGETTDTTPTFSWKAIENATDYQIGHESTEDDSTWHEYYTASSEAGCDQAGSTCALTPSDYTIPLNVEKVWWVRAMVNGDWQDWSRPIIFTVVDDGGNNIEAPTAISPINNATTNTLEFLWTSVNGASHYMLGLEDSNTGDNWQEHRSTSNNCQSGECSYTLDSNSYYSGQDIAWWVKAKVNGEWSEWSKAGLFTFSSNNNSIVPTTMGPTDNVNTIYPQFSWTSVAATEYRIAFEDADSGENYTVLQKKITPEVANCLTGQTCTYIDYSLAAGNSFFSSGKNVVWWIQAKVNGEWGEWSNTGYFSINLSTAEIPDEPYKAFCHGIDPRRNSTNTNLYDGVIAYGKRYFTGPNYRTLRVSEINGTNEQTLAEYPPPGIGRIKRFASVNGALFFSVGRSSIAMVSKNNDVKFIATCYKVCSPSGFHFANNYIVNLRRTRSIHGGGAKFIERSSSTGGNTTTLLDTLKNRSATLDLYSYENNIYFSSTLGDSTFGNNIKQIGKIDDSGELENITSCQ